MRFLIKNKYREEITQWADEHLGPMGYKWFPFYLTDDNEQAFLLHIGAPVDSLAFKLSYKEYISKEAA